MPRLAWYFARQYVAAVALISSLLVVLVVTVTLVENAGELTRDDIGGGTAWRLAAYGAIEYAYLTLPVACFFGLLVAGVHGARSGELLAVQATGRGAWRQATPFVAVASLSALAAAICGERVLPAAVRGRADTQRDAIGHVDPLTQFYTRRTPWFRDGETILFLPEGGTDTSFPRPVVYRLQDGGSLAQVIHAASLSHDDGGWRLHQARVHGLAPARTQRYESLPLALRVRPEDLRGATGNPRELGWRAVRSLIDRRTRASFDTTAHRLELQSRLAFPLSAVALVVLALPWALDCSRRRALSATLGAGVVVIAVHLTGSQMLRLLALAHKIPVAFGAWAPPGLCLLALPLSYCLHGRRRR